MGEAAFDGEVVDEHHSLEVPAGASELLGGVGDRVAQGVEPAGVGGRGPCRSGPGR